MDHAHAPHVEAAAGVRTAQDAHQAMVRLYAQMPFRPKLIEIYRLYLDALASRDGVMTQQTRVMTIVALVTWLLSILIFGTSYGAAPGSFHVVCAGWMIAMIFGSRFTRIALGAITAAIIVWMFVMTMLLHSPLDDYDLVMEVDRWTLRATAVIVFGFLLWEFVGKPSPDAATPKLNRMIGVFTILAWITVAAAGRWIGLGGGGL